MLTKVLYTIFFVSFIWLGWLGAQTGSTLQTLLARVFTLYYFAFFLLMPWWTTMGETKPVPERVTS